MEESPSTLPANWSMAPSWMARPACGWRCLSRSDVFVQTMTEKLLTYGTGRALKYYDMPVVRSIARDAARNDNRFSSLIVGVVKSDPFQMRVKQQETKQ